MAPDLETDDPILKWILQKSPALNLEAEMVIWKDLLHETFASLIELYPTRSKKC